MATFTCELLEGDEVSFSWSFEGVVLREGGRVHIATNPFSSMLTLHGVQATDRGRYTCTGSNSVSEERSSAFLSVEGEDSHRIINVLHVDTAQQRMRGGEPILMALSCQVLSSVKISPSRTVMKRWLISWLPNFVMDHRNISHRFIVLPALGRNSPRSLWRQVP